MESFEDIKKLESYDTVHIKMMLAQLMAENEELKKQLNRILTERNEFLQKLLNIQLPKPLPPDQTKITDSVQTPPFKVLNREKAMQIEDADSMKHLDSLKRPEF